jgi:methylglutaconyl-CoA hydratase
MSARQPGPQASSLVTAQVRGPVATVTLNSPGNANALSAALATQLLAALSATLADPVIRVVTLTGAGRVFCSGADLNEARAGMSGTTGLLTGILQLLWDAPKPVLCRVNGPARAGGIGLIAACDIAIAPHRATFAFPEVRIGVAPALIAVPCLRRMSSRAAAEYFLTGAPFDARRAADIGLISRAVADEELDAAVGQTEQQLLRGAPGALAAAKAVLRDVPVDTVPDGLSRMARVSAKLFAGAEAAEGMAAFAAKRDPSWVVTDDDQAS